MENDSHNESSHLSADISQDCNQPLLPLAFFRQAEMSGLRHLIYLFMCPLQWKKCFQFFIFTLSS